MQYLCLIYAAESAEPAPGSPEFEAMMSEYFAFTEKTKADGVFVAGEALQPVATATTVTRETGSTVTMDGPFAETREQLGGFYLLECKDLDEALHYAAMIPSTKHGRVEVRPTVVFE